MSNSTGDRSDAGPSGLLSTPVQILAARAADRKRIVDIDRAFSAGELSSNEFKAALVNISVTKFPVDYTLGPCPPWCATDHAAMDNLERTEGLREHSSEPVIVSAVNSRATGKAAHVTVSVMDDLEAGVRSPAGVLVSSDDALSPTNARALADAIVLASEIAEAGDPE